jgi:undecaprenyl-diphosphatase
MGHLPWSPVRRHADRHLGVRLVVAAGAAVVAALPVTLLAVLVVAAWDPLRDLDESAARGLHDAVVGHPVAVDALKAWTDVFSPWPFRLVVVAMAGWLVYRGAPRLAAWALVTIVTGGVLGVLAKALIGRARPHLPHPVAHAPGASFPSGHALTATLGCGIVLLALLPAVHGRWRALAWTLATVIPLFTGMTRIALGVHWVSDVVGGWLLGIAVVLATAAGFEAWRRDVGRTPGRPGRTGVEPEAAAELESPGPHRGGAH